MNNVKLTKKEKDFLIDWLEEDLELSIKNESLNDWGKNKLKSIIKKLKTTKRI
jgi:hypothetical protein